MVADLNVHWDHAEDGSPKPHAHVMLSMREVSGDGGGGRLWQARSREWNATSELPGVARALERSTSTGGWLELGIEARIDHRSLIATQGVELEPQS